jgi:hypothetical protein
MWDFAGRNGPPTGPRNVAGEMTSPVIRSLLDTTLANSIAAAKLIRRELDNLAISRMPIFARIIVRVCCGPWACRIAAALIR